MGNKTEQDKDPNSLLPPFTSYIESLVYVAQRTYFRNMMNNVGHDASLDAALAMVTQPGNIAISMGVTLARFGITEKALPKIELPELITELFKKIPTKLKDIAKDVVVDSCIGMAMDLSYGRIDSPKSVAVSITASTVASLITSLTSNKELKKLIDDKVGVIKDRIKKEFSSIKESVGQRLSWDDVHKMSKTEETASTKLEDSLGLDDRTDDATTEQKKQSKQ